MEEFIMKKYITNRLKIKYDEDYYQNTKNEQ